jgi:hypothetical protein
MFKDAIFTLETSDHYITDVSILLDVPATPKDADLGSGVFSGKRVTEPA